jgi:dsDNA-specific endonuclease/ATPase MutS2
MFRDLLRNLSKAELIHRLEKADHALMRMENMLNMYNERGGNVNPLVDESFVKAEEQLRTIRQELRSEVQAFLDRSGVA